jgi:hypothetical protein
MAEFVTVALGSKNAAGDWVVNERVDVQSFETGFRQIVITPRLDQGTGYNLTHVQSGFFLLGPFQTLTSAREAAVRLSRLFSIEDWNEMGAVSQSWKRSRIKQLFNWLKPQDKEWMRRNGVGL